MRTPDGQSVVLGPGDIIGRLSGAALPLDDVRISEAHAMVSLRGRELKLLGLRGRFAIAEASTDEAVLQEGMRVTLAQGLDLVVESIALPDELLAIEGDGIPRQVLSSAASIAVVPRPMLLPRYRPDAAAYIWDNGESWRIRIGEEQSRDLHPEDTFRIGSFSFRAVAVRLEQAGKKATHLDETLSPPLHIVSNFDTVHIHAEGRSVLALNGISARILSELVSIAGPTSWEVVAGEIWSDESDRFQLRRRWDIALVRLRRRLREGRIRPDLVHTGGTGQIELLLHPDDRVEDRA